MEQLSFPLGWKSCASKAAPKHQLHIGPTGLIGRLQLAQDFLFSVVFWVFSGRRAGPPSDLAKAVREAKLEAEPDKFPLLRFSGMTPPWSLSPALRRLAGPVALFTRPGFTRRPYPGLHLKYCLPPMEPSFLPVGEESKRIR